MWSRLVEGVAVPRPAERARLGALAGVVSAWSAAGAVALIAGQAWTITAAPGALGPRYIAAGLIGTALVGGWWWALGRMRQDRAAIAVTAVVLCAAIAARAMWAADPVAGPAILAFAFGASLDGIGAAVAGELVRGTFSAAQDRRLGYLISGAGVAAPAVTGVIVLIAGPRIGIGGLIVAEVAMLAVAGAATVALGGMQRGRFAPDRSLAPPEPSIAVDLRRVVADDVPLAFAAYALALGLAIALTDGMLASSQAHRDAGRLIAFYTGFIAWGTVIGAVVGAAIQRTVQERHGVLVGLLVLPIAMSAALIAVFWADGAGWAVTGARMMPLVFGSAAHAALRLVVIPVAPLFRPRAVLLFRAVAIPVATLVAGVIATLVGVRGAVPAAIALVSASAAVGVAFRAWTSWKYAVVGTIKRQPTNPVVDEGARPALSVALADPDPSTVLNALDLVGTVADARAWSDDLAALLGNPSPLVRARTLILLARSPNVRHYEGVRSRISDPEPEVRAAAIGACFEIAGEKAVSDARNMLSDPHPAVRSAVVEGLMAHGGAAGTRIAGDELRKMVASEEPRLRCAAARVVGTLYAPTVREMLLGLLGDPSADVRCAAIEVAGASGDAALLPRLVIALQDRRTAPIAARALAQFRDGIERDLGFAVDDARRPIEIRCQVARIIGRMDTALALETLMARIAVPTDGVRTAVHRALARMVETTGIVPPVDVVEEQLAEEIRQAEEWLQRWIDFGGREARGTLLEDALRSRTEASVERAFLLIRARWPRHARSLEQAFADWSAGRGGPEVAGERVLGFLQGDLRERTGRVLVWYGKRSRSVEDAVSRLLSSTDPWLVVAALEYPRAKRLQALAADIDDICGEAENLPALAAEAAELARKTLRGEPRGDEMLTTVEKILVLKAVPLLAAIPAEQLVSVAAIAKPVRFDDGALVFHKGDQGDSLYLVVHGTALVMVGDREVARLGPGEVFGEMAILDSEPRSADVVTGSPLVALRIDRDEFHDLIDERPEVLRGIVRVLIQRLRTAVAR